MYWAYEILLGRKPESEAVIDSNLATYATIQELRRGIMSSPEYRARMTSDAYAGGKPAIAIAPLEDGLRVFVDISDLVSGFGVVNGTGEVQERAFVRAHLAPGDVALDLGANVGLFTVTMAAAVGPTGQVVAFEPVERSLALLRKSIAENGFEDRVRVEPVALSCQAGVSRMLVAPEGQASASHLVHADPRETTEVRTVRLDDVDLPRPVRLVKIDVEGAEAMALAGAERLLREDRPTILAELNPNRLPDVSGKTPRQFVEQLEDLGYRCETLEGGAPDLEATSVTSVVFSPRS